MTFFWMLILLLALLVYVVIDGYDLGIGALTLLQRNPVRNRARVELVGNVWDGNESWIILLAIGLMAGFPEAYATALPGLYLPICLMLFGLIFRGFALEMTLQRRGFNRIWGRLFGVGSLVAAFAQGLLFGGLLCGLPVIDHRFAGGTWDFLGHGYALLTGCATVLLYAWAGATQLQAKLGWDASGMPRRVLRRLTVAAAVASLLCAVLLPVATSARLSLAGVDRWLPFGYGVLLAAGGFWTVYRRAGRGPRQVGFFAAAAAQTGGLVALVSLYYPQLVPPSVTVYSAAASRSTLVFLTAMIGLIGPGTVAYGIYSHWVFRSRSATEAVPRTGEPAAPTQTPSALELKGSY
ncbi:cytochrome d ubiquinol oxidase subunit II [Jatrophihabitans sp. DSM 45814]